MPSLLRRCTTLLRVPGNELAFALRTRVGWSRGLATLPTESKQGLFDHAAAADRPGLQATEARLLADYDLEALRERSTRRVYAANLAMLAGLEQLAANEVLPLGGDRVLRAVDVGCGDFHYATALQRWLGRRVGSPGGEIVLRGLEVDAYGIYRDGHSRADHARAHAALAARAGGTVRFEVADFTRVPLPAQDVVSLQFPFLSAYALLRWGLPLSKLRPRRLLERAVATVRPGGWLVVANQTAVEFGRLCALLAGQPVVLCRQVSLATALVEDPERTGDRVGSLWRRVNDLPLAPVCG